MNYFRNRFQRHHQSSLNGDNYWHKDGHSRRHSDFHQSGYDTLGSLYGSKKYQHQPASSTFTSSSATPASKFSSNSSSTSSSFRRRQRPLSSNVIECSEQSYQPMSQRRRRILSEISSQVQSNHNGGDQGHHHRHGQANYPLSETKVRDHEKPKDDKTNVIVKEDPGGTDPVTPKRVATVSKSSSLRRRRHSSSNQNGNQNNDVNPVKRGHFSQNTLPDSAMNKDKNVHGVSQPERLGDYEDDTLADSIEVKSAAQWKAMSQRISFKFDDDQNDKANDDHEPLPINFSLTGDKNSNFEGFTPTKVRQLRLLCWKVKPWVSSRPNNRLFSSQFAVGWGVDCDEVYPGLFIGDRNSASNIAFLRKIGVTHVLNTAEGNEEGLVNLSQSHYESTDIEYLGFPLWDTPNCNVLPYMGCAADFIATAIENGGKCLVNCQMGVSRSATCAMAYLMIKKNMTAVEVLTQCRQNRDVRPNDGFLEQIVQLDNDLRAARELEVEPKIKLSSINDYHRLPKPWNFEFWTNEPSEEEIGLPLVKLGQPCPIKPEPSLPSSSQSSRLMSRRSSRKSVGSWKSVKSSRSVSRHSSFKAVRTSSPSVADDTEGDWEWVWEDEDDDVNDLDGNYENIDPQLQVPPITLTEEKLQEVKDIIEKPEEKWRILWQNHRCDSPASVCSSIRSIASNASNLSCNKIQPGLDTNDPLSGVKVGSAKQWKTISKRLTINLEGIDLNDDTQHESVDECNRPKTPFDFRPTTAQQLRLICWRVKPKDYQSTSRALYSSILGQGWGVDCDEVHPGVFIGDEASARNIKFLHKVGITHVLNVAEGFWPDYSFVNLNKEHYQGSGISYQGIQLWDSSKAKILPFFGCFNEFIKNAIESGGKCLVSCQMGVSRSCTAAMVYMMISHGWEAADVLREFRKRRDVRPNDFFLEQIAELDNELRKEKVFGIQSSIKLNSLSDLSRLPKPWHFEFWEPEPEQDTLPFKLCHYPGEMMTNEAASDLVEKGEELPVKQVEVKDEESEDEWEYYTDSSEEENKTKNDQSTNLLDIEPHEEKLNQNVVDMNCSVGSAKEWLELSEKLTENCLSLPQSVDIDDTADDRTSTLDEPVAPFSEVKRPRPTVPFRPTQEKDLRLICWRVKPWLDKRPSKLFSSHISVMWNVDCDEVYPNLFIGDQASAKNIKFLEHLNIKYVLNTAEGKDEGLADLSPEYFEGTDIEYKGMLMWDSAWFDVSPFIDDAVDFIDKAMSQGQRILVHCQMGVSRSSTCAIAYAMTKLGMMASTALRQFREHRDVRPNDGFLKYLVNLDNKLRYKREGYEDD